MPDIEKVDLLPWIQNAESRESHKDISDALKAQDNVFIDETAFIARGAHVYPSALTLGAQSYIACGAVVRDDVHIGDHCTINAYAHVSGKVRMGNGVRIASMVTIVGNNHGFDDVHTPIYMQAHSTQGIIIEDDVWIGANVVICDGVTVGAHSIVAAGAIVVKDVTAYSIVGGNPAKLIRDRRDSKKSKPQNNSIASTLKTVSDNIHQEFYKILERSISTDTEAYSGEKQYINMPTSDHAIRPSCDAIEIAAAIDLEAPLKTRQEYIQRLQSLQESQYGFICDPSTKLPDARSDILELPDGYNFLCVGYALECLGSGIKNFISIISDIQSNELYQYFSEMNWQEGGWGCGSWTDAYATAMYHNFKHHHKNPQASAMQPEALFGWLDMHCNAASGMWSPPNASNGWQQAVNGFYRLTRGTYAQFGRPLPHPERAIDTILSHCHHNGHFLEKNITACNVLDVIHPLWLCAKQTDYRSAEIQIIIEKNICAIAQRWHTDKGFAFSPDQEPSLMGTEMWLSILAIAADYLDLGDTYDYHPKGVHRMDIGYQL